jgi:hypothetical protein
MWQTMKAFGIGLGAVLIIVGFPLLLLAALSVLGWLEAWMVQPDERAATVERMLQADAEAEEIEAAVARLMAEVADRPASRTPSRGAP